MLSLTSVLLFFFFREKEDDLERRFVLLDQELRDILAIEGKKKHQIVICVEFILSCYFS